MEYQPLLKMLEEYKFKKYRSGMTTFRNNSQTVNIGNTKKMLTRANGLAPSKAMIENKGQIYNECKRIFPDFEFTSVQLNKNFKCPKHFDGKNLGNSMIMALGNFTGGDLFVSGKRIDIKYKPFIFNGSLEEHWTDDFEGDYLI